MSRGPGNLQREILGLVQRRPGVSVDEVIWGIASTRARGACGPGVSPGGHVRKSVYISVRRAVSGLERRDLLRRSRRKLQSLDELAELFPMKTLRVDVRRVRERLLPHLEGIAASGRYRMAEREDYLAAQIEPAQTAEWKTLRSELIALLPDASSRQNLILRTVSRGDQLLLQTSDVKVFTSLASLIHTALTEGGASEAEADVYRRLRDLYTKVFPKAVRGHAALKSRLYDWVDFRSGMKSRVKEELKMKLLAIDRNFVESLDGHIRSTSSKFVAWLEPNPPSFSPLLDQLITRDALRRFELLLPST